MASNLQRPLGGKSKRGSSLRGFALRLALALGVIGFVALILSRIDLTHDLHRLHATMLSGVKDGSFYAIVDRAGKIAAEQRGSITNVTTDGSVENVKRLVASAKTCDVQFALALDGSDWTGGATTPTPLVLLGRLAKPESVLFLGKDADHLREFGDLRGLKIGVGPAGSGTERLARQIFALPELAGLGVTLETHVFDEQLALLVSGGLDLGVFVMDEDVPLVASAIRDKGLGLAGFAHADAIARRLPHIKIGEVDAGAYDAVRLLPAEDKKVMRVDTLIVGNGCAGRIASMDLLTVFSKQYTDFARHNKDTANTTALASAPVADEFFANGGPEIADLYVPWLVEVMPPANWAYVVMGVSILFNAMGAGHRFRLWRIDAARVHLEESLVHIFGPTITLGDIQNLSPASEAKYRDPAVRAGMAALIGEFQDLAARSRKYSLSMLVPMGQEMAYRYQEGVIYETLAVLRDFVKRADAATGNVKKDV